MVGSIQTRIAYSAPNTWQAADASTRASGFLHIADQPVGDIGAGGAVGFVIHRKDQQKAALRFFHRYAGLLDFARQPRFRLLHFVLHLHRAVSGSVPCSKVTVMLTEPSELLVELAEQMVEAGEPLPMTWVTLFSRVSVDAPV